LTLDDSRSAQKTHPVTPHIHRCVSSPLILSAADASLWLAAAIVIFF
jgi:hypothetical protein